MADDDRQLQGARQAFDSGERLLIADVVSAETVRTLHGWRYRASRNDIVALLERLLREPKVRFGVDEVIFHALQANRETDSDFADSPVVYKALKIASIDDGPHAVDAFDASALQLSHIAAPRASPRLVPR